MPILAVEQPRYLPDIEFFFKMKHADVFVLADNLQFSSHSSINRARIKTVNGPTWLTVPVLTKDKAKQSIKDVVIDPTYRWKSNHFRTLEVNYCMAPYFDRYHQFLKTSFAKNWSRLIDLNLHFIKYFSHEILNKSRFILGSELPKVKDRSQRVVAWLRATHCDTYLVSKSQKPLLDVSLIQKNGFKVKTFEFRCPRYFQQFGEFTHGLSIIDLLCNEGANSIDLLTKE